MSDQQLTLVQQSNGYLWIANFPYSVGLKDYIKQFPGCAWLPDQKSWLIPGELVDKIARYARNKNWKVTKKPLRTESKVEEIHNDKLHPYQRIGIETAIRAPAFMLNWSMGLGKSVAAIECLKARKDRNILLVCPAMARLNWFNKKEGTGEFAKWWPERLDDIEVVSTGKIAAKSEAPIRIASYGLLEKLRHDLPIDAVVFDEIHYLAYPKTDRSFWARQLVGRNPKAWRLGLTGTPVYNKLDSLWHPFHVLYPGRFGALAATGKVPFKFKMRYMQADIAEFPGGSAYQFTGINKDNEKELQQRLSQISQRVTKEEVAHLLPSFNVGLVTYLGQPEPTIKEWVANNLQQGETHMALMSWTRAGAKALAEKIKKVPVFVVTGEDLPKKRHELLARAREEESAVVCATIDSTRESIDMTFCTSALYVDLPATPLQISQSLGRFHRLSGKSSVNVGILTNKNGDEKAVRLFEKIEVISKIIQAGTEESALQKSLSGIQSQHRLSSDELAELLQASQGLGW